MKIGRGIGIAVSLLLVVIVAIVFYLLSSLDAIVAGAIEKYGSQATQTSVRVASVEIVLKSGEGTINGLRVGNPAGFSAPDIFTLDRIQTRIDTGSVTADPIIIDEITVSAPQVVYEINAAGQSNLKVLQSNIEQASGQGTTEPMEEESAGPGLVIRKLVVERGQISARVAALGGKDLSTPLPRIEMNDIGAKEGGASPAEVATRITTALLERVGPAVTNLGLDKYLGKGLEEVTGAVGGVIDKKAGESLGDAAKKGTEKLKNLLGE
jgi:hypothetical protein